MKRLFTLIRVALKVNFGLSVVYHRVFRQKKDIWIVPVAVLVLISIIPTIYGYLKLIEGIYGALKSAGQEQALLTFALLAGQFLILIFGLYYVLSAFYFSRDLEMLIPLPLKPFEVMMSKFTVILVNEYLTVLPIVAPVLVYFGILAKAGLSYWVNALIIYLLLPVIPLAIVSILVVGMMRIVNLSRKKDALIIVGSLLLITAGIGLQFVLGRSGRSELDAGAIVNFFTAPDSLLKKVGAGFPPSIWATKALAGAFSGPGLRNLLIFAGTSLVLFCGMLATAEKMFYRGLVGISEISGRRKALSQAEMSRQVLSGRRPVRAIFWREWRIMNRTPIFLLNGVLTAIIIPVIFVVMARSGTGDNAFILKAMVSAKSVSVILASACFLLICGCLNGTSSSTFSREGGQFWMSKVIPVTPREQVMAKFLHSYLIALLGISAGSLLLILLLHLRFAVCAAAIMFGLVGAVGMTALGMIIDLARPLLEWTNPQKAIKQNLNVLFSIFADIGILGVLGFFVRVLVRAGIHGNAILAIVFASLILLSWLSYWFLLRMAAKRYREIEV